MRAIAIWTALCAVMIAPVLFATTSPFLSGRSVAYLIGGFAGIVALSVLFVQPILAMGILPRMPPPKSRKWHRTLGAVLVGLVVVHVGGLYLTSPPDTLDALLLVSPTPFSVYGVIAMWVTFATAGLALLRKKMRLRVWTFIHTAMALIIVIGTVIHAMQIQGAMEPVSKWSICIAALLASGAAVWRKWRHMWF